MAASDNLNFEQHDSGALERVMAARDVTRGTHGTSFAETPLTSIEPSVLHGQTAFTASDRTRAYYTAHKSEDPASAVRGGWRYAMVAAKRKTPGGYLQRPVVHEVTPEGKLNVDPNANPHGKRGEMTASRLNVTGTHWTPDPDLVNMGAGTADAVQGTLENENWNKYSTDEGQHNYLSLKAGSGRWPTDEEPRGAQHAINPDQLSLWSEAPKPRPLFDENDLG